MTCQSDVIFWEKKMKLASMYTFECSGIMENWISHKLRPSGIGSRSRRNRLWVRFLAVSDIYSRFHRAYDYLGPFRVLWVHMAWHKNCVKKIISLEQRNIMTTWHDSWQYVITRPAKIRQIRGPTRSDPTRLAGPSDPWTTLDGLIIMAFTWAQIYKVVHKISDLNVS